MLKLYVPLSEGLPRRVLAALPKAVPVQYQEQRDGQVLLVIVA